MLWLIKSNLPFSSACGGVRNLFSSSTAIPGCQPAVQRQCKRCPLCVCVCTHTCACVCMCMCAGSRERCCPWAMLAYAGHIPMYPGGRTCLMVPTCMCLVDMPAPGEPCGCPGLLGPLEADAPSSLCASFSYICEPCAPVLEHEHLGLLWPSARWDDGSTLSGKSPMCPPATQQPPEWGPGSGTPGRLGKGFGDLFFQHLGAKKETAPVLGYRSIWKSPSADTQAGLGSGQAGC